MIPLIVGVLAFVLGAVWHKALPNECTTGVYAPSKEVAHAESEEGKEKRYESNGVLNDDDVAEAKTAS